MKTEPNTKKKYNKLDCGCQWEDANYEDNIFCPKHTKHTEIALAIAEDAKRLLIRFVNN